MPPYPITVAANYFSQDKGSDIEILQAVNKAMNVYYNWTGLAGKCFDLNDGGPSTLGDLGGFIYLICYPFLLYS